MFYIPIHKIKYRIFKKLVYLIIPVFLILQSCTKEKILKTDLIIDNKIFCIGYFDNVKNNSGFTIFGNNLLSKEIKVKFTLNNLEYPIQLIYYKDGSSYTEYLKHDFKNINFSKNDNIKIVIYYGKENDTILLETNIPDSFNYIPNLKYINTNEYYYTIKIPQANEKNLFKTSYSFTSDTNSIIGFLGYTYSGKTLPIISNNLTGNHYNDEFNQKNFMSGIRMPSFPYNEFSSGCLYIPNNKYLNTNIYCFSGNDLIFINTFENNYNNLGNPFFSFYQAKNLEKSDKNFIYGKIISSFKLRTAPIYIKDNSENIITFKIFDKNNLNITNSANYVINLISNSGLENYKNGDSICITQNNIYTKYTKCKEDNYNLQNFNTFDFSIKAYNKIDKKTYFSNVVKTNLKDKKSFNLKLK